MNSSDLSWTPTSSSARFFTYHNRTILSTILITAFILSLYGVDWKNGVVHSGGGSTALEIVASMFQPELSVEILVLGLKASLETLAYATAGMSLAILIAIPGGILASGTLSQSTFWSWLMRILVRPLLGGMRAIHELVWAWLFVAAFGLSPLTAVIALAIPYGGILGRILADKLNDVDDNPLQSLEAAGASTAQTLLFGRIPLVLPDVISYTMFRYECAVRSAAIMSFIGLGGLGYQIEISLDDLHFSQAWTFVYFLVGLVVLISWWSNCVRKRLVS